MFTFIDTNLAESSPITWDMAKQIIQAQSNLAILAISVLVVLAGLSFAGSLIWNISLRKKEIKKAIESLKSEMLCEGEKNFMHLKKEITDEVNEIIRGTEKNISSQMTLLEAEKARLFAYINEKDTLWAEAAAWWADAVVGYAKCKYDDILRIAVVALCRTLKECEKKEMPLSENQRGRIKEGLSDIPEILGKEKKEIEDKFDKLSG